MYLHTSVVDLFLHRVFKGFLVGGFNPFEKYYSNWIIFPGRDENKKYLKPPGRFSCIGLHLQSSGSDPIQGPKEH